MPSTASRLTLHAGLSRPVILAALTLAATYHPFARQLPLRCGHNRALVVVAILLIIDDHPIVRFVEVVSSFRVGVQERQMPTLRGGLHDR